MGPRRALVAQTAIYRSRVILQNHSESSYGYSLVTVDGNKITVVFYAYDQLQYLDPI